MKLKILFIANGKSIKLKKIEKLFQNAGLPPYHLIITKTSSEAIEIAKSNANEYSHIIAIGGDGTLHEVVNGVMQAIGDSEGPVLSFIPAGTANDFAKSVSFPKNINEVIECLNHPTVLSTDVGEIKCVSKEGKPILGYFINIADAGVGAAVVKEVNMQPKKWGPNIAFFRSIIKAFKTYRNISVECIADDWEWQGKIKTFVMANGRFYGSGLMIAPHAKVNDGKLAITIAADISTYDYIKHLPGLKRGEKIKHPQLFYKETTTLQLTSKELCPIEADGELFGFTPAVIRVLPQRLKFLVTKNATKQ